jgi:hypothetical protein
VLTCTIIINKKNNFKSLLKKKNLPPTKSVKDCDRRKKNSSPRTPNCFEISEAGKHDTLIGSNLEVWRKPLNFDEEKNLQSKKKMGNYCIFSSSSFSSFVCFLQK